MKTGTKNTETATKVSTLAPVSAPAKSGAKKRRAPVSKDRTIQPYDEEAWRYMSGPSIDGAHCPIYYIGQKVSSDIAEILGRPMTIEEAQYLVHADGPVVTCHSEGVPFQPVKYVPFCPDNLRAAIAAGKKLTTTSLLWGGAFHVGKDNEPIALSGAVYHYSADRRRYEYFNASPLVKMASALEKIHGRKIWGKPWEDIQRIIRSRNESMEREKRIAGIADNVYVPEGRFTKFADALSNAGKDRRMHGNGRSDPYKRNNRPVTETAE